MVRAVQAITRSVPAPVRSGAVFSPETPGYEEWLRRQAQPVRKSEIVNRKSKI